MILYEFYKKLDKFIFSKKSKKNKTLFSPTSLSTSLTDRRVPGSAHSAPALTTARTAFNRRVLADGDLAGDETCTYVFPSTSGTRLGYRLNELEPCTSSPAAMAARRRRAR